MLTLSQGSIPDRRDLVKTKAKVCLAVDAIVYQDINQNTGRASRQAESNTCKVVLLRAFKGVSLMSKRHQPSGANVRRSDRCKTP
jgi:hypothetical protein